MDGTDEQKQQLIANVKEVMGGLGGILRDAKKLSEMKEKEALRRNRIVGTLNADPIIKGFEIKEYDLIQGAKP